MDSKFILKLFPEVEEIANENLRNKTIAAILTSIEEGKWTEETVFQAPVTINWHCECTLIEHVRAVTQVCIQVYDIVKKFYERNGTPFDRDTIIAGALVHDIGKFLEFTLKDGQVVHEPKYSYMRHPFLGALVAEKEGLPKELVYLIARHSFEGDKSEHKAESDFVRRLDMLVFHDTVFGLEKIKK